MECESDLRPGFRSNALVRPGGPFKLDYTIGVDGGANWEPPSPSHTALEKRLLIALRLAFA